jgi:hypothetical protein
MEEPRPDDHPLQETDEETRDLVLSDEEASGVIGGAQKLPSPPGGPVPIPYPNES